MKHKEVHSIEQRDFDIHLNSEMVPSSFIRAANTIGSVPYSNMFRARERTLKLGIFSKNMMDYIHKDMKIRYPLDWFVILCMFALCSYLPSLIVTIMWYTFGSKKEPTY